MTVSYLGTGGQHLRELDNPPFCIPFLADAGHDLAAIISAAQGDALVDATQIVPLTVSKAAVIPRIIQWHLAVRVHGKKVDA